ncbi:MAG: type II secretion system minor pseudopilin GspK [Nitrospirota bacterium]
MALILVLMVLVIITAMIIEFSYGVYTGTGALYNWQSSQRLSLMAKSGIQVSLESISDMNASYPYTYPGVIEMPVVITHSHTPMQEDSDGTIHVRIEDENSKFNINSIVYPNGTLNENAFNSFKRLLSYLAVDSEVANRVADWIDKDSEPRLIYSEDNAKNATLDSLDELLLINGIDRHTYDKISPYLTVYGNGLININSAEIPVLVCLSDTITEELAERIIRYRDIIPFEDTSKIVKVAGLETAGQSLIGRITVKGTSFRIISTVTGGGVKRIVDSVLEISGGTPTVKYWKEI